MIVNDIKCKLSGLKENGTKSINDNVNNTNDDDDFNINNNNYYYWW